MLIYESQALTLDIIEGPSLSKPHASIGMSLRDTEKGSETRRRTPTKNREYKLDTEDRLEELKSAHGIGYCNITKCRTAVCPENITITDNAMIPLKERVVDEFFDPVRKLLRIFRPRQRGDSDAPQESSCLS